MDRRQTYRFRATAGREQDFGATPQEALNGLMNLLEGEALTPIVILPYNQGDAFFTQEQQERLEALKSRRDSLTEVEQQEWAGLVEASFNATISRTKFLPVVKS